MCRVFHTILIIKDIQHNEKILIDSKQSFVFPNKRQITLFKHKIYIEIRFRSKFSEIIHTLLSSSLKYTCPTRRKSLFDNITQPIKYNKTINLCF